MKNFPKKSKLLLNFSSCTSWEEKYIYIIDLGKLLPKFPEEMKKEKYLISGCQSQTWIALTTNFNYYYNNKYKKHLITFYGDSDASIVKGIIAIIFSLYQGLNAHQILNLNVKKFLNQLELNQNLTMSRSQGIYAILNNIKIQAKQHINLIPLN